MNQTESIAVSVVVPVFNEEESVATLCQRLHDAVSCLGRSYELILVDDGSRDRTWDKLREQAQKIPRLRLIRFRARRKFNSRSSGRVNGGIAEQVYQNLFR